MLSATPFFVRGSGYAEGTLFSWTMSDFSLMDAIECAIVKVPQVPQVPVTDNLPEGEMPKFRNAELIDVWEMDEGLEERVRENFNATPVGVIEAEGYTHGHRVH